MVMVCEEGQVARNRTDQFVVVATMFSCKSVEQQGLVNLNYCSGAISRIKYWLVNSYFIFKK